jgi:hypothetical protein
MTRVQLAWLRLQNGTSASRVFVDPNYRKILRSTKMHNIILGRNLLYDYSDNQGFQEPYYAYSMEHETLVSEVAGTK